VAKRVLGCSVFGCSVFGLRCSGVREGGGYQDGTRVTNVFDGAGQITAFQDYNGDWSRSYDGSGVTEAGPPHPNGQPLTHVWNPVGSRVQLETWFGILTYMRDAREAIAGLTDVQNALTTSLFDAAGRTSRETMPDGSVTTFAYDPVGRLIGTHHADALGAELDLALLGHDSAGNPILKVTEDGRHTMTYDPSDQLLSEYHPVSGPKTWGYDPVGNRLSQAATWQGIATVTNWTYDSADQLVNQTANAQVTTFQFDAAGNQQVEHGPEGRTTYAWDGDNRLRGIALPSGALNTMAYRPDGLRTRLVDEEGDKAQVWDSQGSSGYQDLLEEAIE
jgi:YD repeat-containing protein